MGGPTLSYRQLAAVSVRQAFYVNGLFAATTSADPAIDFQFIPSDDCLALMNRLNLLLRPDDRNSGFEVYAEVMGTTMGGLPLVRFYPKDTDRLTFWITAQNPHIVNFDNVSGSVITSGLYYLSNQRSGSPRTNAALTASPTGLSPTTDLMTLTRAEYRYHHPGSLTSADAVVTHLDTGMTIAPDSVVSSVSGSDVIFDLSPLPIGRIRLDILMVPTESRYYVGTNAPMTIFGVVELSLSSALDANYRIIESDYSLTAVRPTYSVTIPNRPTRWRYHVSLTSTSALAREIAALAPAARPAFIAAIGLVSNDPTISFTATWNGESNAVFEANRDIGLQERYLVSTGGSGSRLNFSLNKNTVMGSGGTIVIDALPYPSPALVDTRTPSTSYSDIVVTL